MPAPEARVQGFSLHASLLMLAVCAALLAAAAWWLRAPSEPAWPTAPERPHTPPDRTANAAPTPVSASSASATPAHTVGSTPSAPLHPQAAAPSDPQDLAAHVPAGQAPPMAEVIQRLNEAGVHSGLGAFNPPGTRPPLIGLAVPEDFELPAGFVRHHQATDDGQRIEAVLMFAADHPYVLAHPELSSRVVPPALAPEGLPLRRITLPPPRSRTP